MAAQMNLKGLQTFEAPWLLTDSNYGRIGLK